MKTKPSKKKCSKIGYKTKQEANKALNDYGRMVGNIRVYRCPYHALELWHLTSETR